MRKRIIAFGFAAVAILGLAGIALAASTDRAPYALEQAAVSLAADPNPPAPAPKDAAAQRQQLQGCVKPKVDAGAQRPAARNECAGQLGIKLDELAKPAPRQPAHADLIVPKRGAEGQWETVVMDRGTVTAASADSISVQRPDGPTVTIKVTSSTKVQGAPSAAELAPGRAVVVRSAGGDARLIVARR